MTQLNLDVLHTHKTKALGSLLTLLQHAREGANEQGEIKVGCTIASLDGLKKSLLNVFHRDWDAMANEIVLLRAENDRLRGVQ